MIYRPTNHENKPITGQGKETRTQQKPKQTLAHIACCYGNCNAKGVSVTPTATLNDLLNSVDVTESYVHGSTIYRCYSKTVFKEEALAGRKSDPCLQKFAKHYLENSPSKLQKVLSD